MQFIPYGKHLIDAKDVQTVAKTLQGPLIARGPSVQKFENKLSLKLGAKYAVCVSSGSAALHLACIASGINPRDEVITTPLTFAATANCVMHCQAKPVFADVDPLSANILPEEIEKRVTRRTKAIIPVHFAGVPADLKSIQNIAKRFSLAVIEDASHALGATYHRTKIGGCNFSDMTILSFHPVKHITTGEGGAIMTNSKRIYERLISLRNNGIVRTSAKKMEPWRYDIKHLGFNYHMTDFQSMLGVSQLNKLNKFIKQRKNIAEFYLKAFENNTFFHLPSKPRLCTSAWHLFPILLKKQYISLRYRVFTALQKMNIGAQVHYVPLYKHTLFKKMGYHQADYPGSELFYNREISLPIYPSLDRKSQQYIVNTINGIFAKEGGRLS